MYCCDKFYKKILGGIYLETLPGLGKYGKSCPILHFSIETLYFKAGRIDCSVFMTNNTVHSKTQTSVQLVILLGQSDDSSDGMGRGGSGDGGDTTSTHLAFVQSISNLLMLLRKHEVVPIFYWPQYFISLVFPP